MLMITPHKSALSTAHLSQYYESDVVRSEVMTATLARACKENNLDRIRLLKVDCEGSEYGIFETMTTDLASRIDQIALEVHDVERKSMDVLAANLEGFGFSVVRKGRNWYAIRSDRKH